ncbi:MAG: hypothetical protein A3A43_03305 [Candidatus Liptonbacteria bacterium RIFCSPLOWO2_01_FULL_56_20]|uniref:Uncharacterized protein n=1 Tax=Candidatus Liptonbacteria bacterium RIFCSPLOWO2_01_FULL_56_20 TaxID=1798652 RepID=A0A1G2CKV7_9BACT|nr:MAG: hypothetical protein UY96_C0004G0006 [Parcubacteria group bacterium GW2011_GWB1_56_8]OGY98523.1 MAG: hypothetical protein A2681_01550 [Candidatus Liptonbacteria bacterium RIFCSPHIGHO2_01_FULL_56_18b]OGZ01852.1 MAG: hypothetical protein A3A43_03305 [Candidatus Liptonbacteria bacterium RIFCSPLOWO2_01_FULL_56_20]
MSKIGPEYLFPQDKESGYLRQVRDAFAHAVEHGTPEEAGRAWDNYRRALDEMPLERRGARALPEEKKLIEEAERLTRKAQARGIDLPPSDFLKRWAEMLSRGEKDLDEPGGEASPPGGEMADLEKEAAELMRKESQPKGD